MRQSIKWLLFILLATAVVVGILPPLLDSSLAVDWLMSEPNSLVSIFNPATGHSLLPLQIWLTSVDWSIIVRSEITDTIIALSFVVLALVSTYKLSEYIVPRRGVGSMATFILMSMIAFLTISSIDLGAQAIGAGSLIFAIWQGVVAVGGGGVGAGDSSFSRRSFERFRFMPHLGFAGGLALSMWSLGIYGVVVAMIATIIYMIASRRIKWIVSTRFLLILSLALILTLPVLWIPYYAYGWQGVRDLLYGELLSATSVIGDQGWMGTMLYGVTGIWLVLPWSFLVIYFAFSSIVKRQIETIHFVTLVTSIIVIILFSFFAVRLVLLIVLLPLFAIFLADKLRAIEVRTPAMRGVAITQKIAVSIVIASAIVTNYYYFPFDRIWVAVVYGLLLGVEIYALFRPWLHVRTIVAYSVAASALLFIGLNFNFYPQLAKSQSKALEERKIEMTPMQRSDTTVVAPNIMLPKI